MRSLSSYLIARALQQLIVAFSEITLSLSVVGPLHEKTAGPVINALPRDALYFGPGIVGNQQGGIFVISSVCDHILGPTAIWSSWWCQRGHARDGTSLWRKGGGQVDLWRRRQLRHASWWWGRQLRHVERRGGHRLWQAEWWVRQLWHVERREGHQLWQARYNAAPPGLPSDCCLRSAAVWSPSQSPAKRWGELTLGQAAGCSSATQSRLHTSSRSAFSNRKVHSTPTKAQGGEGQGCQNHRRA